MNLLSEKTCNPCQGDVSFLKGNTISDLLSELAAKMDTHYL